MDANRTVYVVTEGFYSDMSVVAVFSEQATAERYCEVKNRAKGTDAYAFSAYPLDPVDPGMGAERWWYSVQFASGGSHWSTLRDDVEMAPEQAIDAYVDPYGRHIVQVWVEARDPEHALKIASDKRAEWLARRENVA